MPGPVSGSYDPEFGTGENAARVADAILKVRGIITQTIGDPTLKPILEVGAQHNRGAKKELRLTERELRILRFAVNRALESI